MDHWAYRYLDRLRERGHLGELDPLVRPHRREAVASAIRELRLDRIAQPERGWLELLRGEFRDELEAGRGAGSDVDAGLDLRAGARASSSDRFDPLRPTGGGGAWPYAEGGAWLEAGPVVAVTRVRSDAYFPDDPDGEDVGRRLEARSEEAYLAAQFPVASIFVGRIARNWGPRGRPGLMLSAEPATYPQLGLELCAGPVRIHSILAELDTLGPDRRYLAAHRVDVAPSSDLALSFGEAILYTAPDAGLSPRFLIPVSSFFFDQDNAPPDYNMNLMLDLQVWVRRPGFVLHGEGLIDDLDVRPQGEEREPSQYALRLGVELPGLVPRLDISLDYTLISAYAYRTLLNVDDYRYLGRGLGANFADFDRIELRGDLHVGLPGLTLSPVLTYERQGEGDVRDPLDFTAQEWVQQPSLFLGVKERTFRAALAGHYQPAAHLWVSWDLGVNWVEDADHVAGRSASEFVGRGEAGFRLRI